MRIAVNARCLLNRNIGPGYYTFHLFAEVARQHPEHTFMFLSDAPLTLDLPQNASIITVGRPVKGYFTLERWISKVRKALKDHNADVFVSLDGSASLSSTIPQVIGVTDLKFVDAHKGIGAFFFHRYQQKAFQKASTVITVSAAVKQEIADRFAVQPGVIHVVPKAPKEIFKPVEWEQREAVRSTYTGGREYFLFTGGFDPSKNPMGVLKGFSQFKKWQQSNMKLLITGNTSTDPGGIKQKIETFKFREDVVVLGKVEPEQSHLLTASAYALIYPALEGSYGIPVLEAMRSGTAVITSKLIQAGIAEDAVLYVDANDETAIGDQMIRLYKDEALRSRLIEKSLQESAKFNWKYAAETVWDLIGTLCLKREEERGSS